MSCPFMLLKLYLDPLNFGRGYKRIYFLLERTNRTFQSHTDIYHLFSLFCLRKRAKTVTMLFLSGQHVVDMGV